MDTEAVTERQDPAPDLDAESYWVFLVDPAWQPPESGLAADRSAESAEADEDDEPVTERLGPTPPPPEPPTPAQPPAAAIVGGWLVAPDGIADRFHPNPDYRPSHPDSPTDPVDATLRMVIQGQADTEVLLSTIREAYFGVALGEDGDPLVAKSPDDVLAVMVTTAPGHRSRVRAAGWRELSAAELADILPDEGIDVLLNPGAPSSMRLLTSALKELTASSTE